MTSAIAPKSYRVALRRRVVVTQKAGKGEGTKYLNGLRPAHLVGGLLLQVKSVLSVGNFLIAAGLGFDHLRANGIPHQAGKRIQLELQKDSCPIGLYRSHADIQGIGNLLIRPSLCEKG